MQHRIEYALFIGFRSAILLLPLSGARRVGSFLGGIAYRLLGRRRAIAVDNLTRAFPDKSHDEILRIAKGSFRNYGIAILEFLWFPRFDDATLARAVRIRNPEIMAANAAPGKGLIMLSGHFGNWELIALGVSRLTRMPITIIVQEQSNRLIDGVINRHRCLMGNRVVPMGMSIREILRTLHQGGVIAIAPDQSGPQEGPFVEFFGQMVATHQGPAAFSLRSGAPMLYGFIFRQKDGNYEAVLEKVDSSDLASDDPGNIVELTRRHTLLLERYIREYPDHWLWMHRRWKHTLESVQRAGVAEAVR
jgi:KDO2-lipid IV(A) lauroyltransferase